MLPILHIFSFSIQTPALVVMISFYLGLQVTGWQARRYMLNANGITDACFLGALAGVLGARAGYVLLNIQSYLREPLSALMPNTTALLPWAGWLVAIVFTTYWLWRKRLISTRLPDVLAMGSLVLLTGIALASFCSGDDFGTTAQLPWAVYLWGQWRHPVQLYDMLALLVILVVLLSIAKVHWPGGALALLALALASIERVFVDGFRAGSPLWEGLRVTQLAGVVVGVVSVWLLSMLLNEKGRDDPECQKQSSSPT